MGAIFDQYCLGTMIASGDCVDGLIERKIRSFYHNNFMTFQPICLRNAALLENDVSSLLSNLSRF